MAAPIPRLAPVTSATRPSSVSIRLSSRAERRGASAAPMLDTTDAYARVYARV